MIIILRFYCAYLFGFIVLQGMVSQVIALEAILLLLYSMDISVLHLIMEWLGPIELVLELTPGVWIIINIIVVV